MSSRLKPLLPGIIGPNQSTFIKGRRITDSILLTPELCHSLHSGVGRARMCIKIDLRQAFDSLNRTFLCEALHHLGFEHKWVAWMSMCMKSMYSLRINGELTSPSPTSNGVRQGDPLSPYLFVIAMQILTALFEKAELEGELKPPSCGTTSMSHIIFADDQLVFLQADKQNACQLKSILEEFSTLFGLSINLQKSMVYFGGQMKHRRWITSHLGLSSGEHPVRFLVPDRRGQAIPSLKRSPAYLTPCTRRTRTSPPFVRLRTRRTKSRQLNSS